MLTADCTSFGTTSPRYRRQQATAKRDSNTSALREIRISEFAHCISHRAGRISPKDIKSEVTEVVRTIKDPAAGLAIWFPASKQEKVISATEFCSWKALSAEMIGAYVANGKWIRGNLKSLTFINGHRATDSFNCDARYKVRLELIKIHVKTAIKTQRRSHARDNLGNNPVKIGESGRCDTKILLADVVNCLIIDLRKQLGKYRTSMKEQV